MGVVYEAFDRDLGARVALKCLPTASPEAILRFKREFRAMRDLNHRNLVSLGELMFESGHFFFTMELVTGVDIISYCWGESSRSGAGCARAPVSSATESTLTASHPQWTSPWPDRARARGAAPPRVEAARLRAAFAQLTRGLSALHSAQKVHRDVKPSNVLVSEAGRVVLLDFGVAADLEDPRWPAGDLVGTVGYMAPEQAARRSVGPAADWYSLGVVLFETLTGRLPFEGSYEEVLRRRQRETAPDARDFAKQVPEDLAQLCQLLLRRDPVQRANGDRVLATLDARPAPIAVMPSLGQRAKLVGRKRELSCLCDALGRTRERKVSTVLITGESGSGKTALLRRFLELASEQPNTVVLSGACSEREYVPYKALDSAVDDLVRFAKTSSPELSDALERLRPDLSRAFAAFSRQAPTKGQTQRERGDPFVQRSRLFAAIRELFSLLAQERTTILALDDMQWADTDSVALLSALLRPPNAPPLLVVITSRSAQALTAGLGSAVLQHVELGNLPEPESAKLALQLLAEAETDGSSHPELAARIAREAGGHPLFINELVRQALRGGGHWPSLPRLEAVFCSRVDEVGRLGRRVIQLIALAGGPLPIRLLTCCVSESAFHAPQHLPETLRRLRDERLLRIIANREVASVELYHDRIGAALLGDLADAERARLHRDLAEALEATPDAEPEALAVHWYGAGERDTAAALAKIAADRAADALAFEEAARLYQLSLEYQPKAADVSAIYERMGETLANAGRGAHAAEAYLEAAQRCAGLARIDLERRAADQLLRSGHVDEAEPLIERVLSSIGVSNPTTRLHSVPALFFARARLGLRAGSSEPSFSALDERQRVELDACWAMAVGLSMIDSVRGAHAQVRHLLLARRHRDPLSLIRGLAAEAGYVATAGQHASARAERLLAEAEVLAADVSDAYAGGFIKLSSAICSFLGGAWRNSYSAARSAEAIFERRPAGAMWELASSRTFGFWSSFYLGEFARLRERVPDLIQEAENRGDLYAATLHRTGLITVAWLAAGEPDTARGQLAEAERRWSRKSFHFQHYLSALGYGLLDLYEQVAPARSHERLLDIWEPLRQSQYLRIQNVRIEAAYVRGISALARARAGDERALRDAGRCAARIEREGVDWGNALALLIRAGVAAGEGGSEQAIRHLDAAETASEACSMRAFALAARLRRGLLQGRERAALAKAEARAAWAPSEVVDPERLLALFAP